MSDILSQIKEHKLEEVAAAKKRTPLAALRDEAAAQSPARGFARLLKGRSNGSPRTPGRKPRLIAEIKKASPSAGLIRDDFDAVTIAMSYAAGGANAISCLTDETFFKGSLEFLKLVRLAVHLPVLRKDFILDPWQVWESRAAGADAILLIAGMVDWDLQAGLREEARAAGLDVLLEIHGAEELQPALALAPDLLGINNRNLRTRDLTTSLATTRDLAAAVPALQGLVSESGIRSAADVRELSALGVDAVLVGEHLMREIDPGRAIAERLGLGPAPWPETA